MSFVGLKTHMYFAIFSLPTYAFGKKTSWAHSSTLLLRSCKVSRPYAMKSATRSDPQIDVLNWRRAQTKNVSRFSSNISILFGSSCRDALSHAFPRISERKFACLQRQAATQVKPGRLSRQARVTVTRKNTLFSFLFSHHFHWKSQSGEG
jgi:hypothetical protein